MKRKTAYIFPGQGAQYVGMGRDFFEHYSVVRELFEEADECLRRSLSRVIFDGPDSLLTETHNSQVAIYVVSMAILRVLEQEFPDLQPSACAGFSLGEYSALTASKRLAFADCLPLVQKRGELMSRACEQTEGTMAAIIGLSTPEVEEAIAGLGMHNDLWIANFNCPGQVVISGTGEGVTAGIKAMQAAGARRALPLRVHGAFHSGLMQSAESELQASIDSAPFIDSAIDLVMNVPGGLVRDQSEMRRLLVKQVTSSVRWEQGIRCLDQMGTERYIEIGCGKALSGFNKRIKVCGNTLSIERVSDLEILEKEYSHAAVT